MILILICCNHVLNLTGDFREGAFQRPPCTLSNQVFRGGRPVFQGGQAPSGPLEIRPLRQTDRRQANVHNTTLHAAYARPLVRSANNAQTVSHTSSNIWTSCMSKVTFRESLSFATGREVTMYLLLSSLNSRLTTRSWSGPASAAIQVTQ